MNSVANTAKPIGITIIAGPGVKNSMHPIKTIEIPNKNKILVNFFLFELKQSQVIFSRIPLPSIDSMITFDISVYFI